jgi:ribosome modulation factor
MDRTEFGNLLDRISQMIEKSAPMEAEYLRGYYQGIKYYYRGGMIHVRDHYQLRKMAEVAHSDPYHAAHLRGYRDGCDGKKPLFTPNANDFPSERDKATG